MSKAVLLKEEGNRFFQHGDYVSAEALYSKALIADPKNPALYTNRAMARLKMRLWESVIADCDSCLGLSGGDDEPQTGTAKARMKAHFYLSQAHLALGGFGEALDHAVRAHRLCVETDDKSLQVITQQVRRAKLERWDDAERRRVRADSALEADLVAALERERDEALQRETTGQDDIVRDYDAKIDALRAVFERGRPAADKRRAVPDWAIDDISFGIMVDPVVTKTGKSYERASIMEHLARQSTDPLTREPLVASELRPNLGLKQACEEFLNENGWAVDW